MKCNKTQIEIAISRNYLSDIENDRYMPSVPVMVALSKRLGVDLNLLTEMTEIQVKRK
ncbi:MAG: helix-turn-helix domain-containing protein [Zhenhengia sp.]|uniref:helix-turn-helix domain-containing protein n=1 Tax=Zhenhengia sp. TaxID=2944208 RepID=UPI003992AE86